MADKKYVVVSLDDAKLGVLADVLSNKTSKKILEYLAEKEASESEIANDLGFPANTVGYNIDKLLKAGLIEKSKNYFWSIRGKKIVYYRVAKKSIIISPKNSNAVKIIGTFFIVGIGAILVKLFSVSYLQKATINIASDVNRTIAQNLPAASGSGDVLDASYSGAEAVKAAASNLAVQNASGAMSWVFEPWLWFIIGALTIAVVYVLLSAAGKLKRKSW